MYVDKYAEYLKQIPADIQAMKDSGRRHVFGYTSNYDVVLKLDINVYNQILAEYLKEPPKAKPGDTMNSIEDFARISADCLIRGIGANFDILNVEVCEFLQSHFASESALGGTCAQGVAALATLGFPMAAQLTDKCKEVCKMMNFPGVEVVQGDQLVPIMEGASDEAPVYHMIVQFSKDDKVIIGEKEYVIPHSNRLILFYDTIHKTVPVDDCFYTYWEDHADRVASYLVAGFDAVLDESIMNAHLDRMTEHIQKMKEKNPDFIFYVEGAYYMNPKVKELLFGRMAPYADIIGTNDEELIAQNEAYGVITDPSEAYSVLEGVAAMRDRYGVKGVILHTSDYSMYYGNHLKVDIEQGLTMGNIMAGTRARVGHYGSLEECIETLNYELSDYGLHVHDVFESMESMNQITVVPSRYIDHPKYTIGLGDTFVSGVHTCFK